MTLRLIKPSFSFIRLIRLDKEMMTRLGWVMHICLEQQELNFTHILPVNFLLFCVPYVHREFIGDF